MQCQAKSCTFWSCRSAGLDCAHTIIDGSQGKPSDHRVVPSAPSSHALARNPTALSPEIVFFSQHYRANEGPKQHAAVHLLQVNPRFASSSSLTILAYIAHLCSSQINSLQWSLARLYKSYCAATIKLHRLPAVQVF